MKQNGFNTFGFDKTLQFKCAKHSSVKVWCVLQYNSSGEFSVFLKDVTEVQSLKQLKSMEHCQNFVKTYGAQVLQCSGLGVMQCNSADWPISPPQFPLTHPRASPLFCQFGPPDTCILVPIVTHTSYTTCVTPRSQDACMLVILIIQGAILASLTNRILAYESH